MPDNDWGPAQGHAVREAEAYLDRLAARLQEPGRQVETVVISSPDPARAIVDQIDVRHADLVVMGTHSRSGLDRLIAGSVAKGVVARTPVPVLLVRNGSTGHDLSRLGKPPRFLVPLDGTSFAEAALPVAKSLAGDVGAELILLRSVRPLLPKSGLLDGIPPPLDERQEELREEALRYLGQTADRFGLGQSVIALDARVAQPAEAVVAASCEHLAGLVVMSTHARTGPARFLRGSVAGQVLRRSTVPLLLVRPALQRAPADRSKAPSAYGRSLLTTARGSIVE
jgi:nucleotide-binding universal stress UspA family protein